MPVLARLVEEAGIATILVTMMPFYAELGGVARTLAVEFPYGQTMGHDEAQQMRVLREALGVLETAVPPNTIIHSNESWHAPQKEAYKTWQPAEASPIIAHIAPMLRDMMRNKGKD